MLAVDFFYGDCALMPRRLYVLFVLEAGDRHLHVLGLTGHPDGLWTTGHRPSDGRAGELEHIRCGRNEVPCTQ